MDTIYFSHDSHELCLTDFEHLEQRDLICIISALEHNTWFTKLRASANTAKLSGEVLDKILAVVAKSMSLQVNLFRFSLCYLYNLSVFRRSTFPARG